MKHTGAASKSMLGLAMATALAIAPRLADADGCYVSAEDVLVQSTAQRAAIWLRSDAVELHLQASYAGGVEDFGWVVPLPERPEVDEGSAELLDALDEHTAPEFTVRCHVCDECFCPAGPGDGVSDSAVSVWEQGTVGPLDYSIISATEGDGLRAWLDANGFHMPEAAGPILDDYAEGGWYFFAATVRPDAEPDGSLATVTFSLPAETAPFYPMRITAVSSPEPVEVLLWVIADSFFVPANYPTATVDPSLVQAPPSWWDPMDMEGAVEEMRSQYEAALASIEGRDGGGTFVIQAATGFWNAAPELLELEEADLLVTRLHATLPAGAMVEDVLFEPSTRSSVDNEFLDSYTGPECFGPDRVCDPDDPDDPDDPGTMAAGGGCSLSPSARRSGGWALPLAAAAFLTVWVLVRSRR